jgi:dephospho-CoA kinase
VLRVGLTGGIACGKSAVLRRLSAAGLRTLDLDAVAHDVMSPGGAAYADVVRDFGPGILGEGGSIDRRRLGEIVFADTEARARLNRLVHPRVREEEVRRAAALRAEPGAVLVTDAALLVESGVHLHFDRLVVVHCSPEQQLKRLRARDDIDERAARLRIEAQMPIEEKRRFAHFEVDTSGSVADTERGADRLAASLQNLAAAPHEPFAVPAARALGGLVHGPGSGPRGLRPSAVLAEIVSAGGPEMERFARLLSPPSSGPWYRAARALEPGPGPECLAVPLVLWGLGRRGNDGELLAAAMASTARLTHADPVTISRACFFALALAEVAATDHPYRDLPAKMSRWTALAARWGGAPPGAAMVRLIEGVARRPEDLEAARAAAREAGVDEGLGGALFGAHAGRDPTTAAADLRELVERLPRPGS